MAENNRTRVRQIGAKKAFDRISTEKMLVFASIIEDYLFSRNRLWPQFESTLENRLRIDPGLRAEAVKACERVERRYNRKMEFRADLPEDIRGLLDEARKLESVVLDFII